MIVIPQKIRLLALEPFEDLLKKYNISKDQVDFRVGLRYAITKTNLALISKELREISPDIMIYPAWESKAETGTLFDSGEIFCSYTFAQYPYLTEGYLADLSKKAGVKLHSMTEGKKGWNLVWRTFKTFDSIKILKDEPGTRYCDINFRVKPKNSQKN